MEGINESSVSTVRESGSFRVGWGAVLGGAIAALSTWILLYSLGLAAGLSSVDPNDSGSSLRASGIFTGVWGLVVPLIALFVGGLVASRRGGIFSKGDGALQGLLVWSVTTLAGVWLVMNLLSSVVGGAFSVGKSALQTGGAAIGQAAGGAGDAARSFGIDADALLGPVNQRLQAQGRPTVTSDQLQTALRDTMGTAVRTGRLDRSLVTQSLAQNTALSTTDAEQVAGQVEQQFNAFRSQAGGAVSGLAQGAQAGALRAADATGKLFWGVFGALFLGLAAAVGGAILGAKQNQDRLHTRATGVGTGAAESMGGMRPATVRPSPNVPPDASNRI